MNGEETELVWFYAYFLSETGGFNFGRTVEVLAGSIIFARFIEALMC
jgi:hypothetical protein